MDDAHGQIDSSAHVVGLEFADECVKRGRGRADAQEERDFDEENDEGADPGRVISDTYRRRKMYYPQAYHCKQNDPMEEEDVANAQTKAEDHADDSGPGEKC